MTSGALLIYCVGIVPIQLSFWSTCVCVQAFDSGQSWWRWLRWQGLATVHAEKFTTLHARIGTDWL